MSEFPAGENYKTPVSASHNRYLNPLGIASDYPFVVKREKGAYVLDLDGNKYVDFDMNRGSVILGHNDGRLTHSIKNALSTGTSTVFLNKFVHRVVRQLKALASFERLAYFEVRQPRRGGRSEIGGGSVCTNKSHVLGICNAPRPSQAEIAVPADLRPRDTRSRRYNRDLGDTDFGHTREVESVLRDAVRVPDPFRYP
jgi:hypothetical protein